jgi:hypothetical protein
MVIAALSIEMDPRIKSEDDGCGVFFARQVWGDFRPVGMECFLAGKCTFSLSAHPYPT